jgi:signal transduction histidine kinase
MNISDFLREHPDIVIADWEALSRPELASHRVLDRASLRDHITDVLAFIVDHLDGIILPPASPCGFGGNRGDAPEFRARVPINQRFAMGFDTLEILSEYCLLRDSIVRLWSEESDHSPEMMKELYRFNRLMDDVLCESLSFHTERSNRARNLFLGTLIHDLKNPLNAILQSVELLKYLDEMTQKQELLVSQIGQSAVRISDLATKLIDATRIRLGKGLGIERAPMDFGAAAHDIVREVLAAHPERKILLETLGDLSGEWDSLRVREVISNLVGNAVQHGKPDAPVSVSLTGENGEVTLSVHNDGRPIPADMLPHIFDPLTRGGDEGRKERANLGLGLYIAREIVSAHGGRIEAMSGGETGTTFTAHFPRHA